MQKTKYIRISILVFLCLLFPGITAAQTATTLFDLIGIGAEIVRRLIPLAVALGLVVFLWGMLRFIYAAGNEQAIAAGRSLMVWGIITLFVMVSVWGLVALLNNTLGIAPGGNVTVPTLNTTR
jgi:hypothetical protein